MSLYANIELILDTVVGTGKYDYWQKLKLARSEYAKNTKIVAPTFEDEANGFYYFMQHEFGIKVMLDEQGNITNNFEIIDEHKYLLFELKYTK